MSYPTRRREGRVALPDDPDTFVLLENSRPGGFGDGRSLLFTDPVDVVECCTFSGVFRAVEKIKAAAEKGLFAAG
ncbi:MAG TPA: hypothetical protein EYQ81_14550, partial [Sneathiellales bacterium]|nr:hypothetical protein [Sneathiellales bacterium]